MGQPSAEEIRSALLDVDYPATKDVLVEGARRNGAGDEVVKTLRALPQESYTGVHEVIRSVDTAEATAQSPADKVCSRPGARQGRPGRTHARRPCPPPRPGCLSRLTSGVSDRVPGRGSSRCSNSLAR